MKYRIAIASLALVGIFVGGNARGVEALSTAELISHCQFYDEEPDGADGIFCVRYIQGFIDGAVATDERVTYNVAREFEDSSSSFRERAVRTRLGQRLERFGPSVYAEFCLGDPVPLAEVVRKVIADLEQLDGADDIPLAGNAVYRTLREHYPCSSSSDG